MTNTFTGRGRPAHSLIGRRAAGICLSGAAALILGGCGGNSGTAGPGSTAGSSSQATIASGASGPSTLSASAAPSGTSAHDLLPADIVKRGYINVPMTFGSPPGAFNDESGKPTGELIELSQALSKPLGVEVKVVQAPWDSVLAGIQSGRFDAQIGQVRITDERRKQMNFVTLQKFQLEMAIAAKNVSTLRDWPDFCGLEVAQLAGSLQIETVNAQSKKYCEDAGKPAISVVTFKDSVDQYQAVLVGRVAGSVNDASTIGYQIKQSDGKLQRASEIVLTDQPIGIAIGKDKTELARAMAAALQELMDDGTYRKILADWGLVDLALPTGEFLPATG